MPAPSNERVRAWGAVLVLAAVAAADLLTKAMARSGLPPEGVAIGLGTELETSGNTGVAFGFLAGAPAAALLLAPVAMLALLLWLARSADRRLRWPAAVLMGGAVGNLIDRLGDREVTDFIDPPRWPAFNLADIAITVGVLWSALLLSRGTSARSAPTGGGDVIRQG